MDDTPAKKSEDDQLKHDPLDDETTQEGDQEEIDEFEREIGADNEEPRSKNQEVGDETASESDTRDSGQVGMTVNPEEEQPDQTTAKLDQSYLLQVVRTSESPKWSLSEEELLIGHQPLPGGFTQYWAYPKDSGKVAQSLPEAEALAQHHPTQKPAVLVHQEGDNLTLIIVNSAHAFGKTESTVANLEDNLTTVLEFAKDRFGLNVESFLTTRQVTPETNHRLDQIAQTEKKVVVEDEPAQPNDFNPNDVFRPSSDRPVSEAKGFNWNNLFLVLIVLFLLGGGFYLWQNKSKVASLKDSLMAKFASSTSIKPNPSPTPIPTIAPTPAPTVDKTQYQIRVLNGTPTTGAAGKLADSLKTAGWQILGTPTNATNSAFVQTQIRIKKAGDPVTAEALKTDLAGTYEATISANLPASDKADLEVIIGKQ